MPNNPLKGQNAYVGFTFPWGNVRAQQVRVRQTVKKDESTGVGDKTDANFVDGVRVRQISWSGIVVDGVPDLGTAKITGSFILKMDGTDLNKFSGTVQQEEIEWVVDFTKGAAITCTGSGMITGPLTVSGEGTHV